MSLNSVSKYIESVRTVPDETMANNSCNANKITNIRAKIQDVAAYLETLAYGKTDDNLPMQLISGLYAEQYEKNRSRYGLKAAAKVLLDILPEDPIKGLSEIDIHQKSDAERNSMYSSLQDAYGSAEMTVAEEFICWMKHISNVYDSKTSYTETKAKESTGGAIVFEEGEKKRLSPTSEEDILFGYAYKQDVDSLTSLILNQETLGALLEGKIYVPSFYTSGRKAVAPKIPAEIYVRKVEDVLSRLESMVYEKVSFPIQHIKSKVQEAAVALAKSFPCKDELYAMDSTAAKKMSESRIVRVCENFMDWVQLASMSYELKIVSQCYEVVKVNNKDKVFLKPNAALPDMGLLEKDIDLVTDVLLDPEKLDAVLQGDLNLIESDFKITLKQVESQKTATQARLDEFL